MLWKIINSEKIDQALCALPSK